MELLSEKTTCPCCNQQTGERTYAKLTATEWEKWSDIHNSYKEEFWASLRRYMCILFIKSLFLVAVFLLLFGLHFATIPSITTGLACLILYTVNVRRSNLREKRNEETLFKNRFQEANEFLESLGLVRLHVRGDIRGPNGEKPIML